jgi:RHS repeat-associated protein
MALCLEEADAQGNAQVDYVYLSGRPIATIQADNSIHFLHDDRLGTPLAATDSSGSVVWSTTYQPFGQISSAPTVITQDLRLPGQEADVETGLNHNGFRNYAPGLGRYLETDPIGLRGGTNRYAYADGNPIAKTDRLGLAHGFDISGLYNNQVNAMNNQTIPETVYANSVLSVPALPAAPKPHASNEMFDADLTPTQYGAILMICIGGTDGQRRRLRSDRSCNR